LITLFVIFFHVVIQTCTCFFLEVRPLEELQDSDSSPRREEVGRRTLRDYGGFLLSFFYRSNLACNEHTSRPAPYRCNSYVGGPVRSVLTVNACDGIKRPTAISHITTLHRTHDGLIVGPPQISHMLISTGAFSASFKDSKELSVPAFANAARTL